MAHYAQAFSIDPGYCFRYVHHPGRQGQPMRCPAEPALRGAFRDGRGRVWSVEACEDHAGDLLRARSAAET